MRKSEQKERKMTASSNSKFSAEDRSGKQSTAESRRASKPLMEKRRRARINQSLSILKTLIVDSQRVEGQKHTKLEKADILEMTVSHLQNAKKSDEEKFMEGYEECFVETTKFLEKCKINATVIDKLTNHLRKFRQNLDISALTSVNGGAVTTSVAVKEEPNSLLTLGTTISEVDSMKTFPLSVPRFKIDPSKASVGSSRSSCPSPSMSNDSNNNNFVAEMEKFRNVLPSPTCTENNYCGPSETSDRLQPSLASSLSPQISGQFVQDAGPSSSQDSFVLNLSTHHNDVVDMDTDDKSISDTGEPLDFSKPLNLCKHPLGYRLSEDGVWRPW